MEGLLVVDGKKVELILFPSCTSLSPLSDLLLLLHLHIHLLRLTKVYKCLHGLLSPTLAHVVLHVFSTPALILHVSVFAIVHNEVSPLNV